MKAAILSQALPPSWGGQALVILRLLRGVDPESYCLLTGSTYRAFYAGRHSEELPGVPTLLPPEPRLRRPSRYGLDYPREFLNLILGIGARALSVRRVLRGEKADLLVAFTGDLVDFPAGLLASRLAGARFVAYVLDDFREREVGDGPDERVRARAARMLEPVVLRRAHAVVVANELMRDELERRYGLQAVVIHNSCELEDYRATREPVREGARFRLVYTGTVYDAHYDAFRNLIRAVEEEPDAELHVYTAQDAELLSRNGIRSPSRIHSYLPAGEMPRVQREADVLFLPLAFESPYPAVIRTSAPFKLGEYLASGRPILVHAPRDSFVASYARRHGCGLVVDEPDPGALRRAIQRLREDAELRRRLAVAARLRAVEDFDAERAREQFSRLVGFGS